MIESDFDDRQLLRSFLDGLGRPVVTCRSAQEFLAAVKPGAVGCVVLELKLSDGNGLALIETLRRNDTPLVPVVVSAATDVPSAVRAVRLGAFQVFEKPVSRSTLREAVAEALSNSLRLRDSLSRRQRAMNSLANLTPGQLALLRFLVSGETNKSAATFLGVGVRTVERVRSQVLERIGVKSLIQAAQLIYDAGLEREPVMGSRTESVVLAKSAVRQRAAEST